MSKRRRRRNPSISDLIVRPGKDIEGYSDFNLKRYHVQYIINMVDVYEISTEMMEIILSLLRIETRSKFVRYLYEDSVPDVEENDFDENNYYDVIDSFYDPSMVASDIVEDIYNKRLKKKLHEITDYIKIVLNKELKLCKKLVSKDFEERLDNISSIFNLDCEDASILSFVYCLYEINSSTFSNLCSDLEYRDFLRVISVATGVNRTTVRGKVSLQGQLYKSGVIEDITPQRSDFFKIDEAISEYLAGISDVSLIEKFIKKDRAKAFKLSTFIVPEDEINIMKDLLKSPGPVNILLYGVAGTGKTEFARSLVRSLGPDLYFLQFGTDDRSKSRKSSNLDDRLLALNVGISSVQSQNAVLVVDEADFILNTRPYFFGSNETLDKGYLNNLLDRSKSKIIWISNEVGRMEESTLRRFSYNSCFMDFSDEQRYNIWKNIIKGHPFRDRISDRLMKELSDEFHVNAGGIASALDALVSVFSDKDPSEEEVTKILKGTLRKHENLVKGGSKKMGKELFKLTDRYDLSVLNTDLNMNSILDAAEKLSSKIKAGDILNINMNLLFWGLPGTGKTEFAKYLANKTEMTLIIKRYSDLVTKWVGESEQNIAKAFREASDRKAILFIDEADSLFGSRENAVRSWEVSRTNELLTQMENFRGILICCTNLLPNLDRAAMRRFNWKVEFKPMKPKAVKKLYQKYFKLPGKKLTEKQRKRLASFEGLTPGDIKSVWNRMSFLDDGSLTHGMIIDELEKELSYKDLGNGAGVVGF